MSDRVYPLGYTQSVVVTAFPARFVMKLTRIGNSLRLTIPKPVVDGLGFKGGDFLILLVSNHEIKIRKAQEKTT
jgi:bifunctional DNA-binding transcriptional regulator/antitoxin component of YhaV-PrlF toxin-antitoxin module